MIPRDSSLLNSFLASRSLSGSNLRTLQDAGGLLVWIWWRALRGASAMEIGEVRKGDRLVFIQELLEIIFSKEDRDWS